MAMEVIFFNKFIGPLISKFVANNFVKVLSRMKSYKERNYEQALIETFLKFDELLRNERINKFLKDNHKLRNNKYEIENYGIESSYTENDVSSNEKSKSVGNNSNPLINTSDKGNWREVISNSQINSNGVSIDKLKSPISSPRSKAISEDNKSNEILILDNNKIEISIRRATEGVITEDLIANNMGSTANILFIKNNNLYIANAGDSMAVMFKNGEAVRLNQEHKPSLPSETTRISKSGAKVVNNRIEGRLNLTRAIGI